MTFYDVFEHLCAEKGVTPTQAGRDNGIAQGVISMWKKRGSTPKAQTVQKLANYFNVPIALFFNFNDLNTMSETLDVLAKISPDAIITRLDNSANDDDAEIHINLSKGKVEYDAHVEAHELIDRLNEIGALRVVWYMDELLSNPFYQKAAQEPPQGPSPQDGETITENGENPPESPTGPDKHT